MEIVVDCSVALSWCFKDEVSSGTQSILRLAGQVGIVIPPLWYAELGNGLLMGQRRNRITDDDIAAFIAMLDMLSIQTDHDGEVAVFRRILPLCRLHKLTTYDALYLELAERRNLPLATLDKDLMKAALSLGITVMNGML